MIFGHLFCNLPLGMLFLEQTPLTGFQVTRHKLADMATLAEVAREYT